MHNPPGASRGRLHMRVDLSTGRGVSWRDSVVNSFIFQGLLSVPSAAYWCSQSPVPCSFGNFLGSDAFPDVLGYFRMWRSERTASWSLCLRFRTVCRSLKGGVRFLHPERGHQHSAVTSVAGPRWPYHSLLCVTSSVHLLQLPRRHNMRSRNNQRATVRQTVACRSSSLLVSLTQRHGLRLALSAATHPPG